MSLDMKSGLAGEMRQFYIRKLNTELYGKHIRYKVDLIAFDSHENIYVK